MSLLFFKKKYAHKVTFATSCYEADWEELLLKQNSLDNMINSHLFDFAQKKLVINNVKNLRNVLKIANNLQKREILTDVTVANEKEQALLSFFGLKKTDFKITKDADKYVDVDDNWIYYNALAPLTAIYTCKTNYLLYMTADVKIAKPVNWIEKAILYLEKYPNCKVANLLWNNKKKEAKAQSYKKDRNFFFAKEGFSDQMFLIKVKDFQQPIYQEIRADAKHFPRGDVFEKRVFSYLKNREYERITFRKGYYLHEDTPWDHLTINH